MTTVQAMWVHGSAAMLLYAGGWGSGSGTDTHYMTAFDESGRGQFVSFTDVLGYRDGSGATFRGRAGMTNTVMFAIPTPCWIQDEHTGLFGQQALLKQVGILYTADNQAAFIDGIRLYNMNNFIREDIPFPGRPIHDSNTGGGFLEPLRWTGSHATLEDAATREAEHPTNRIVLDVPQPMNAVGVRIDISFALESNITFHAVGGDFIIRP